MDPHRLNAFESARSVFVLHFLHDITIAIEASGIVKPQRTIAE